MAQSCVANAWFLSTKSSWAIEKLRIETQFDHLSESSRRIVHRTGSLCGPQASQEVSNPDRICYRSNIPTLQLTLLFLKVKLTSLNVIKILLVVLEKQLLKILLNTLLQHQGHLNILMNALNQLNLHK